jgi:AcrR family transcriptional regulator
MGGRLIDKAKLERNRQARSERKARIIEAARHCFSRHQLASVSLETIGQRARLRDGLAAMFFPSLEELFLTVLKSEVDDWFEALDEALRASDQELAAHELAHVLSDSLRGRDILARMLAILPVMLEQVVESAAAVIFLRAQRDWVERVGAVIEARHARLEPGDGARLLGAMRVMVAGLEPAMRPLGVVGPGLGAVAEAHQLDFHHELEVMLHRQLDGWERGGVR